MFLGILENMAMQMKSKAKGMQAKHAERVGRQHEQRHVFFFQRDTTQKFRST